MLLSLSSFLKWGTWDSKGLLTFWMSGIWWKWSSVYQVLLCQYVSTTACHTPKHTTLHTESCHTIPLSLSCHITAKPSTLYHTTSCRATPLHVRPHYIPHLATPCAIRLQSPSAFFLPHVPQSSPLHHFTWHCFRTQWPMFKSPVLV